MEVKGSVFFKGVAIGKSVMLQWVAPHPGVYGQDRLDLMGYYIFKKRAQNWEGKEMRVDLKLGRRIGINRIKMHCMKF